MRRELRGDRGTLVSQRVEGVAEVGGVPQDGGVGDECEAQGLVDLIVELAAPDVALVGEEQGATQRVQALALVELPPDPPAEFFIGDVVTEVASSDQPPVFVQPLGAPNLRRTPRPSRRKDASTCITSQSEGGPQRVQSPADRSPRGMASDDQFDG